MEAIPLEPRAVPVLVPVPYYPSHDPRPVVQNRRMIQVIALILLLGLFGCLIGAIIVSKHASAATTSRSSGKYYNSDLLMSHHVGSQSPSHAADHKHICTREAIASGH